MAKLVLLRHGQSEWNKRNLFTGWVDIPLSPKGVKEAMAAGKVISDIHFSVIYTSNLIRAQMTAMLAMCEHGTDEIPVFLHEGKDYEVHSEETKKKCIPVIVATELNERMYGDLQGLNKDETRKKFGDEQVKIWRRSYDVPPPNGESLEICANRTIPYFKKKIMPHLEKGENVLISAHGNSLRSIIMELDGLSREEVLELEVPTGKPILYSFENGKMAKDTF